MVKIRRRVTHGLGPSPSITRYGCPDSNQVSALDYRRTRHPIPCLMDPPPAPRTSAGRGELIKGLLTLCKISPIALIGVGGIGKASIALTVPHNERIRQPPGGYR